MREGERSRVQGTPRLRTVPAVSGEGAVRVRLHLAAAATGVIIAACFLRFWLFPFAWIAFVPLLWALHQATTTRQAAFLGLVAGLSTNVPAFYWLVYTMRAFGGFPYPVAALFYVCLSAFTAAQFVVFAVAWRRTGPGFLGLSAPLIWVTLEFLYPNLFPWRMAHSQMHVPLLLQVGDLTGPYALSFALVWVASSVALLIADRVPPRVAWARQSRPLLGATAMTGAILAYGVVRLPQIERIMADAPAARVALVQGNVSIKEKDNIKYFDVNLEKYRQLSATVQDQVDLLVWPETVNQHWVSTEATMLEAANNPFHNLRTNLIFGGLAYRLPAPPAPQEAEEFNSAFLMAQGGRLVGRYDKRILLPFGEYIPGGSYVPAVYDLSPGTGHFTAGRAVRIFDVDGTMVRAKVGQLICFEDIVSDMPRHTTQAGAEILATILNDAWYGDTAAPYQHQALALWRTVENRRYLLRGSNSGVTSIIDAAGRVVAQAGLFTAEVVSGAVPRLQIQTVYTRIGDAFAWIVVMATVIVVWRGPPRGRSNPPRGEARRVR